MFGRMYLRLLLLLSVCIACSPRLVNVTIDDTYGDLHTGAQPTYFGDWEAHLGAAGPGGYINGTSQWLSGNGSFGLEFDGVAVYVFFVIVSDSNLTVTAFLDDKWHPAWHHVYNDGTASAASPYMYNQLVFSSGHVGQGKHSLTVWIVENYQTFFDYAIYTTDDSPLLDPDPGDPFVTQSEGTSRTLSVTSQTGSSSPDNSPTAAPGHGSSTSSNRRTAPGQRRASALIGGSVAGAIACIGLSSWMVFWRRRRRRRAACEHQDTKKTDETVAESEAGCSSEDAISFSIARPTGEDAVPQATSEKSDAWQSAVTKAAAHAHADAGPRRVARGAIAPSNLHSGPAAVVSLKG